MSAVVLLLVAKHVHPAMRREESMYASFKGTNTGSFPSEIELYRYVGLERNA